MAKTPETSQSRQNLPATPVDPWADMDRWLAGFFPADVISPWLRRAGGTGDGPGRGTMPSVDIVDRDGEILVRAELPGVEKKNIDIDVTEDALSIRAQARSEREEDRENYYRREIAHGEIFRSVRLPTEVDPDKAKAHFENGMLEITMPKTRRTRRHRVNVS